MSERRSGKKVNINTGALDALLGGDDPVAASLGVSHPSSAREPQPDPPPSVPPEAHEEHEEPEETKAPPRPAQPSPSPRIAAHGAPTQKLPEPETVEFPEPEEPLRENFSVTIRSDIKELAYSVHDSLYGPPHHYTMGQFIEEAIEAHARKLSTELNGGRPFPPPSNPRRSGRRRRRRR